VINQQRTVAHTKDGTANGHYTKQFVDGLGRTIESCTEQDPAVNGGHTETCSNTQYDNMGRVYRQYVNYYKTKPSSSVSAPPAGTQYTEAEFDALGRPTSNQLKKDGAGVLPATTTAYAISGSTFLATVTDPRGNQRRSYTDVRGRITKTERAWSGCPNGWCTLSMGYDALGRVISITDPSSNVLTYVYDGLGRKISMTDPDMGYWTYGYDDNGNLTRQQDAKGQIITFEYDALNRITRKLLPDTEPIAERAVQFFYDGLGPSADQTCASKGGCL
jgi:YD repeat-containing protein